MAGTRLLAIAGLPVAEIVFREIDPSGQGCCPQIEVLVRNFSQRFAIRSRLLREKKNIFRRFALSGSSARRSNTFKMRQDTLRLIGTNGPS